MNEYAPEHFIKWLQKAIDKINEFERQGREAADGCDQRAYIAAMREKAGVLVGLNGEAQPYLDELENADALDYAERGLETYSYNAGKAIELDSVFYMSALLFPVDHKAGEPHNLELFRNELARRLGL